MKVRAGFSEGSSNDDAVLNCGVLEDLKYFADIVVFDSDGAGFGLPFGFVGLGLSSKSYFVAAVLAGENGASVATSDV